MAVMIVVNVGLLVVVWHYRAQIDSESRKVA